MSIRQLSNDVAVCGQISPDDLETLVDMGFKTIVNNRPDHEVGPELAHSVMEAKAKSLGLAIHYLPMEMGQMPTEPLLEDFRKILDTADKPLLAYCRSGNRSGHIYMGACALK
ncbi:MAG TPA: sulfur transferase domain-containing protein [Limnobacter sp.]|nr:sulfur transferase domain-containing protein [Limnobacter sp.]